MLFTERYVTVNKGTATIDEPILLYKGDKNVEIQFNINNSPFKYRSSADLTYGQLVIQRKNAESIFSPVAKLAGGKVIFVVTSDMIDELNEIGKYTFQIRLFNADKTSRATLPVITDGIEIKQPICDGEEPAGADMANADQAYAARGVTNEPAFDDENNYIKTNWSYGTLISSSNLNKIEKGIYDTRHRILGFYENRHLFNQSFKPQRTNLPLDSRVVLETMNDIENVDLPFVGMIFYVKETDKVYVVQTLKAKKVGMTSLENAVIDSYKEIGSGADIDLSNYVTKDELPSIEGLATQEYVNEQIEAIPEVDLTDYATNSYVDEQIGNINALLDEINGEVI